jgi:hypothetical protein
VGRREAAALNPHKCIIYIDLRVLSSLKSGQNTVDIQRINVSEMVDRLPGLLLS